MYALKCSSIVRREQPISVSPDLRKCAWAIAQPSSTHAYQRSEKHVIIRAEAVELDSGDNTQGGEYDG